MKKALRNSVNVVNSYWPLIFVIGVGGVLGSSHFWQAFAVPILIIVLAITIFIYGRIVADIVPGNTSTALRILQENWLNYLAIVLLLGVPQIALRVLVAGRVSSVLVYLSFSTFLSTVLGVTTIYALPIAFLRKSSLAAIVAGVVYLSRNLAVSVWIVGIVVITNVLTTLGALVFRFEATPWSFVLAMSTAVLGFFFSYVAFAGALQVLIEGGKQKSGCHS